jgi:hypothetical protein
MSFTITDGTTIRDVLDIEITESTNELDTCVILTDGKYTDNISATISDGVTPMFVGFQKSVEQRDDYDVTYNLTFSEKAVEMQYVILISDGLPSFIKTDTASNLMAWAVGLVNTAYGYSGADAWTVDVGSSSATSLSIGCYYTNALAFIRKIAIDNLGVKLWFDSSTKTVYFRQYFTDRTATPIAYISKQEIRDSNKRGCNKVFVIGANSSITGSSGTGNLIRVFEYASAATTNECNNLAAKILSDIQNTSVKYTVTLDEGALCEVADYINLDGTYYVVTQKVTTFDKIVITTDNLTTSIIDTLGSSLVEVTGATVVGTDAQWSPGTQNVSGDQAILTQFKFNCKDAAMITGFTPNINIGKWKSTTPVETNRLSDFSTISNAGAYSGGSSLIGYNTWYLPDGISTDTGCYGMSTDLMPNGFQFGMLTFSGNFAALVSSGYAIVFQWQYAIAGDSASTPFNWTNCGYQVTYDPAIDDFTWLSHSTLISGSSYIESTLGRMRYRLKMTIGNSNAMKSADVYMIAQRSPRHLHSIALDTSEPVVAPATVQYQWNSTVGTWVDIANGQNIPSTLVTGDNTLYIRTATAGIKSSVTIAAQYQTLGKS